MPAAPAPITTTSYWRMPAPNQKARPVTPGRAWSCCLVLDPYPEGRKPSADDQGRTRSNTAVEVHDVLIHQPHTARGHVGSDGPGLGGAVNAVERIAAILEDIE